MYSKWWPYILIALMDRFARRATSNIYYGYSWVRSRSSVVSGRRSHRNPRVPPAALRPRNPRSCGSPVPLSRHPWSTGTLPNRTCLPTVWLDRDLKIMTNRSVLNECIFAIELQDLCDKTICVYCIILKRGNLFFLFLIQDSLRSVP